MARETSMPRALSHDELEAVSGGIIEVLYKIDRAYQAIKEFSHEFWVHAKWAYGYTE